MKPEKEATPARRDFLKKAAFTAPAAVAAGTVLGTGQAQAQVVDPTSDRLQNTAHTRAYYDSARF